jgi:hypothetical protein
VLAGGVLEVGAEPADDAAAFFFGALVVEGDETGQDFFVGEIGGPAVGVGDGEVVVDLAEDCRRAGALLINRIRFHPALHRVSWSLRARWQCASDSVVRMGLIWPHSPKGVT